MNDCVVVFGREPVPGRVKNRLARGIGSEAAAKVYALVLNHTLDVVIESELPFVFSLAEEASASWRQQSDCPQEIQVAGDLGDRMAATFDRRFLEGVDRVVLLGSDCAWVTAAHIDSAIAGLADSEVVLGPANDGGYWLVAQRAPGADLFAGIPWSSPETLHRTRERLAALGSPWTELEQLDDIDTASDLDVILSDSRTPATLREQIIQTLDR